MCFTRYPLLLFSIAVLPRVNTVKVHSSQPAGVISSMPCCTLLQVLSTTSLNQKGSYHDMS